MRAAETFYVRTEEVCENCSTKVSTHEKTYETTEKLTRGNEVPDFDTYMLSWFLILAPNRKFKHSELLKHIVTFGHFKP